MRIHPFVFGVLVQTVFLGVILGFQSAGVWSTSGKITEDGKQVLPSAGDVESIKGWMTLEQITAAYPVTLEEILSQFGLPDGTLPSAALKDLESEVFSVDDLRPWLQSTMEPSGSPPVDIPAAPPTPQAGSSPTSAPTDDTETSDHVDSGTTLTGKTTFQDLLDWGVAEEAIQRAIGGTLPPLSMGVREYAAGQGLEFSSLKAQLQVEVDRQK
jgi:hypothetical protein